jgi:hypothetical protein
VDVGHLDLTSHLRESVRKKVVYLYAHRHPESTVSWA